MSAVRSKSLTVDRLGVAFSLVGPALDYQIDLFQRTILFWDLMRQRGNGYREHLAKTVPHVLRYKVELVADGRTLERPVNYGLVRIVPLPPGGWRRMPAATEGTETQRDTQALERPSRITVREEQVMAFRRPIDAGVPSLLVGHAFSPLKTTSHRDPRRSLYWRSDSRSLGRRGLPTGHRSRPIRQGTRPPQVVGPQGAVGRSRRIGSVWEVYALGRRPQVTLRFAPLHFARPAACLPRTA
ncbi:MAG: DUF3141 domain-containing protein [Rhodoplanes sp.]